MVSKIKDPHMVQQKQIITKSSHKYIKKWIFNLKKKKKKNVLTSCTLQ